MPPFLSGCKKGPVLKTGPFEVLSRYRMPCAPRFRYASSRSRAAPYEILQEHPLLCEHIAVVLIGFRMAYANSAKYLIVRTI